MPIPGLNIEVVDESGNEVESGTKGSLIIKTPWPGMLLGLWKDNEKYKDVYWSKFESLYYPGDYAIKDSDGYLWLLGRSDDVLKVAGHRIGTAELESSIVSHNDVAESAVCGIPDDVKGESIIAFVSTKREHSVLLIINFVLNYVKQSEHKLVLLQLQVNFMLSANYQKLVVEKL